MTNSNPQVTLHRAAGNSDPLRPRAFGSAVRGDDVESSDLDLLVDPTSRTTLMTLAAIQREAERLLGVRVDVLTPKSSPQRCRERALLEAVPV